MGSKFKRRLIYTINKTQVLQYRFSIYARIRRRFISTKLKKPAACGFFLEDTMGINLKKWDQSFIFNKKGGYGTRQNAQRTFKQLDN